MIYVGVISCCIMLVVVVFHMMQSRDVHILLFQDYCYIKVLYI